MVKVSDAVERARKRARDRARLTQTQGFERYQTDIVGYSREVLGVEPWEGRNGNPGQLELLRDIEDSVRRQLEGHPAPKVFRVEAGHGVGKTFIEAVLVNWFFDCFPPSVTMTTAPTKEQVEDLLWKDIKALRPARLPGRVLPGSPRMERGPEWFAYGRTTSDAGGRGTERFQGQHNKYQFIDVDEAEGVADFVYDAIHAMLTGAGGVLIVVLCANPRTRRSRFYRMRSERGVRNYRLSCLDHPNVVDGANTVPGATSRQWVMASVLKWCEAVRQHSEDDFTFELPYDVVDDETGETVHPAGTILLPNAEFCFRVLGIPPTNLAHDTFISSGRYEAATKRAAPEGQDDWARIGVDVSRYGGDAGTIYARHAGRIWRFDAVQKADTDAYVGPIKELARDLAKKGVKSLHVRVDGTGGFGSGIIDSLKNDAEMIGLFEAPQWTATKDAEGYGWKVFEVNFGANAHNEKAYRNLVTEMYAEAAETLKGVFLDRPPEHLDPDLTERPFKYVNYQGVTVKQLQDKETFRREHGNRSPDDGDGFVLCASPDFIFGEPATAPAGNPIAAHLLMSGVRRS